jgi:hypothetical protein
LDLSRRKRVFSAERTAESGSRNFSCDGKKNIRDDNFSTFELKF